MMEDKRPYVPIRDFCKSDYRTQNLTHDFMKLSKLNKGEEDL